MNVNEWLTAQLKGKRIRVGKKAATIEQAWLGAYGGGDYDGPTAEMRLGVRVDGSVRAKQIDLEGYDEIELVDE